MSLCGTDEQLNIELLSQWELEAEFRNQQKNRCHKVARIPGVGCVCVPHPLFMTSKAATMATK